MRSSPTTPSCELCGGRATLYCPSDSAFLCPSCDSHVHLANFLVSRHLRQPLCHSCHSVSPCSTCPASTSSSSSSSACISTTQSSAGCGKTVSEVTSGRRAATRRDARADAVFVIWCKRMGIERYAGSVVPAASRVLEACRGRFRAMPLRVAAAASFWWAVRGWCGGEREELGKKLEVATGVPRKLIMAAEAKLRRAVWEARRRQLGGIDTREGWAECD